MTRAIVTSIALVLSPQPLTPAQEEAPAWQTSAPTASTVGYSPTISPWPPEILDVAESSFVETEKPALIAELTLPAPPPPTAIEAALNRLAELGATPWQLRTFGCLAWYESKNNPYAVSATGDYGILQINRYYHAWRWAGRDIYDPIVNAEVAWDIYRGSGFRAWTTARLCGV